MQTSVLVCFFVRMVMKCKEKPSFPLFSFSVRSIEKMRTSPYLQPPRNDHNLLIAAYSSYLNEMQLHS